MYKQLRLVEDEAKDRTTHIAESYTGIYGMHKYWSKKPYNVIRDFILRYTNRGEIVIDPFCGSGISIAESIFTGRKAIGIDINPAAIFITKHKINKLPTKLIQEEFSRLESEIKDKINSFYMVKRGDKKFVGKFEELVDSNNLLLINEPSQRALKKIPDNSVDYVITDPPHGNRQPYLELSMMWNSWLKKEVNYEDEIVISESKDRKKDRHNYYRLLNEVFGEIERILKPNHYFSLMFNSLDLI